MQESDDMHRTDRQVPTLNQDRFPYIGSCPSKESKLFPYSLDKINMEEIFGKGYKKPKCDCDWNKDCGCGGC